MTLAEIIILSIALAIDALLVSFSYGLILNKKRLFNSLKLGVSFGFFQFITPVIGWFFTGIIFSQIQNYSKWMVFIIFMVLGLKFIKEAFENKEEKADYCITFWCLMCLSVATSIDALAAGVSIRLTGTGIFFPALLIGLIIVLLFLCGFWSANIFKKMPSRPIEILGGALLIFLAIKNLF